VVKLNYSPARFFKITHGTQHGLFHMDRGRFAALLTSYASVILLGIDTDNILADNI
jgi:hypothetical protein